MSELRMTTASGKVRYEQVMREAHSLESYEGNRRTSEETRCRIRRFVCETHQLPSKHLVMQIPILWVHQVC